MVTRHDVLAALGERAEGKVGVSGEERKEMLRALDDSRTSAGWIGRRKEFDAIRALIAGSRGGAVTITKERIKQIVEKYVPCHCDTAYKDRGLVAPDCPRCSFVDEITFEEMLREAGAVTDK